MAHDEEGWDEYHLPVEAFESLVLGYFLLEFR